jgi:hypothetical protein
MDPQACFDAFCHSVATGDLDAAAEAERSYSQWKRKGGFSAEDYDTAPVLRLDTEQDRYLVLADGCERWRHVSSGLAEYAS